MGIRSIRNASRLNAWEELGLDYGTYTVKSNPRVGNNFIFTTDKYSETYEIIKLIRNSNVIVYLCVTRDKERVAIKTTKVALEHGVSSDTLCGLILQGIDLIRCSALEYFTEIRNSYYFPKSETKQRIYTVMKYYEHGNLENFIKEACVPVPENTVVRLLGQITFALANLHSQGIVHGDIKVRNTMQKLTLSLPIY
jgi:serine/threonine protein kinase